MWHETDIANIGANVRFRSQNGHLRAVAELRIVTEFGLSLTEFGQGRQRTV
jgi:hypothetical protein